MPQPSETADFARETNMSVSCGRGPEYRVPVRIVVSADRKATGFHLRGGSTPARLERDASLNPLEQLLLSGGVGLVFTVVQEPGYTTHDS